MKAKQFDSALNLCEEAKIHYIDVPAMRCVINQNIDYIMYCKEMIKNVPITYEQINKSDVLIIMGNGPSLREIMSNPFYVDILRKYDTFGLNAAYRIYDELNFWPTYIGCFDMIVVESHAKSYKGIVNKFKKMFLLAEDYSGKDLLGFEHPNLVKVKLNSRNRRSTEQIISEKFDDLNNWQNSGCNAVQIGLMLGYKKIVLLGIDANYQENLAEVSDVCAADGKKKFVQVTKPISRNPNYWFEGYQQVGDNFNVPNTQIYQLPAWDRLGLSEHAAKIINCSSSTKVNTIQREAFEVVFNIAPKYNLNNVLILNEIGGNLEFFVNKVILSNKLLYLIESKDGKLYKKIYKEEIWNNLIAKMLGFKVFEFLHDMSDVAYDGYVSELPFSSLTIELQSESTNDFEWMLRNYPWNNTNSTGSISVIIPTYNRANILEITLACLCNQVISSPYEVIVADDGSSQDILASVKKFEHLLDIKYVRQRDDGYQLSSVRNLGIRTAKYNWVAILDCDMAPHPNWLQSFINLLKITEEWVLIGPREYIDTSEANYSMFLNKPDVISSLDKVLTNNQVAGVNQGSISVDWRLSYFANTENLRLSNEPFKYFSCGNVAFSKSWLTNGFDESFSNWGGEDNEFGYRLYCSGAYFRAVPAAVAYHQEPPGSENEIDREAGKKITRKLLTNKVPYYYRDIRLSQSSNAYEIPLISVILSTANLGTSCLKVIEYLLNQTVTDLEIIVLDELPGLNLDFNLSSEDSNNKVRCIKVEDNVNGRFLDFASTKCKGFYIMCFNEYFVFERRFIQECLSEFQVNRNLINLYSETSNNNAYIFNMFTIRAISLLQKSYPKGLCGNEVNLIMHKIGDTKQIILGVH